MMPGAGRPGAGAGKAGGMPGGRAGAAGPRGGRPGADPSAGKGGPPGGRSGGFASRMKQMDVNKDGKISKDEFPEQARQFFDRLDRNSDGFLDASEMAVMGGGQRGRDEVLGGRGQSGGRSDHPARLWRFGQHAPG